MQQDRINIFNPVHKALRALLYQTALHIQQTDFCNTEEASETLSTVETVVRVFEGHAHHEDHFVLPSVDLFDRTISEQFEAEHEEDERLSHVLLAAVSACRETDDSAIKQKAGALLFYHFNAFVAFNLYHMNKEETVLNNALWNHYTDEEIIRIQQAIVASVAPEAKAFQSRWMLRGMNNPEITRWLQMIKDTAPLPVYQMHTAMAEEELNPLRWNAISNLLEETMAHA